MKKFVLFIALSFCVATTANAQMTIGPGLELAIPIGDWSGAANFGIGATGQFQYKLNDNMAVTGTTGYIHFLTEDGFSMGMIPLQGGFKYYFVENAYGMAQLGLHFTRVGFSYGGFSDSDTSTDFSFGIGGGYEVELGNMMLDLAGRFQFVDDGNYLGIRAGLVFPIGD
jgi:hypothetical protein